MNGITDINFWDELPCGVYSLSIGSSNVDKCLLGEIKKHEWTNPMLNALVRWERQFVEPMQAELHLMIPSKQPDMHSTCSERIPFELGNYLIIVQIKPIAVPQFLCLII